MAKISLNKNQTAFAALLLLTFFFYFYGKDIAYYYDLKWIIKYPKQYILPIAKLKALQAFRIIQKQY